MQCWKSKVRELDGTERVGRGCAKTAEKMRFSCTKPQKLSSFENSDTRPHFHVDCCQADLCNSGPFPVLEDYTFGNIFSDFQLILFHDKHILI